ncbi:DUF4032 domain-containing protein [Haliovirga abyssi]|uniref:DUF4032 domain-containing protein n=1 Tax=Haliovirga abyssi TaxID=2996794 RepID=A0AAU9DXP9_9FUSO|nr:DUF4032 domain-containing protein [Haliovirga abyssi]BDU50165.1 hypothetical protein HLVA_07340 [Haliovirga abyssi]
MIKIETYIDAKNSYSKFLKESKGFLWFGKKDENLKSFIEVQKENSAYTSVNLGIKDVLIKDIKGSVQKYMDFNKNFVPKNSVIEERWCSIYLAFVNEKPLPPLELYKIKDEYFVYDGNHRVSVAKFLNFVRIEAEVKEFIPSPTTKENAIYNEKFNFEKKTGLNNINFTEMGQYSRLLKEINDYKEYVENFEKKSLDLEKVSKLWYEKIYEPSIKILEENNILSNFKDRTYDDLFIYLLNHKYFTSEKKGRDIGFSYAVINFINMLKLEDSEDSIIKVNEKVEENLEILKETDARKKLDEVIVRKDDILKKETGLNFKHNFLIIFEIDEFMYKNEIEDFQNGVKLWYKDEFMEFFKCFKKKIAFLSNMYLEKFKIITKNRERAYYSLKNYAIKQSNFESELLIANYILERYIPIIDQLKEVELGEDEFIESYFGIESEYNYISKYEDISFKDAKERYFNSINKSYLQSHGWLLLRFKDEERKKDILDYIINKFKEKLLNKNLFDEIVKKYGPIKRYGTVFKLETAMKVYGDSNWLSEKVLKDLEKLSNNNEILTEFKTRITLYKLKEKREMSLIDFYARVLNYGTYLGKDMKYVDIIDLAIEYLNN